jgi:Tfp pilus assembly protein PilX
MRAAKKILHRQSGIALLTTILLMVLMSSMLVGFVLLINSGQKLSGMNNDYGKAFYSAEAGMEKLTADLGTLFDANYAPPIAQVNALQTAPPAIAGVTFVNGDGTPGYTISSTNPVDANGNYLPTITQITSGTYQGMTALATPYLLSVTARTSSGSEVKLQRTTQTVGIPMFQFGVYCDADCSFFAGPNFNFGGRTHTNGNLFLASGATLTMSQNVTAYKDVITYALENGNPVSNGYTGTVNVFNGSGTRTLGPNEGSLQQGPGSAGNSGWPNLSLGASNYAGNLRNGAGSSSPSTSTGAQLLQLGIVTLGGGATQSIDVIRRPPAGEALPVTQERYFAQASLKILLSDNPSDLIGGGANLPCTSTTPPFDLTHLVLAPTDPVAAQIQAYLVGHNETYVPLATSGAVVAGTYTPSTRQAGALTLPPVGDGYWIPGGQPLIHGYIKIEVQTVPYNACSFQDVTKEVLGYGYVGKNINPLGAQGVGTVPVSTGGAPVLPLLPTAAVGSQTSGVAGAVPCHDGHPLAIIRLQRIRDNPSQGNLGNDAGGIGCGTNVAGTTVTIVANNGDDFWPNVLFDTREGLMNNNTPPGTSLTSAAGGANNAVNYTDMVTLGGVMQYVELDVKNVAKYLAGTLGAPDSGPLSHDPSSAPNNYVVYISDRRGNTYSGPNYLQLPTFPGNWPPLSPTQRETGEYGFNDVVNTDANGCPNRTMDAGEDLDGTGTLYNYGQFATQSLRAYSPAPPTAGEWLGGYGYLIIEPTVAALANTPDPKVYGWAPPPYGLNGAAGYNCGITTVPVPYGPNPLPGASDVVWSGTMVIHANEARQNPNPLFRRAVKLVNGADLIDNLDGCPGGITCGLTIAAENPVYIQGDFNCPGCAGNVFNTRDVGASVVGDAVTVLSNAWNDVNSFGGPFDLTVRVATTSYYRTAIIGGKGVPFPELDGVKDFGTDGGVHNFMRELENWGAVNMNYTGSLVCLFTNRQAVGLYKSGGNVYSPPVRNYSFDSNFLNPSLLPPRTPLFRDVNTTGFTQLLSPGQ